MEDLITGLSFPIDVAVDPAAGKLYWTNRGDVLQRSNLDGSSVESVTATSIGFGLAIDVAASKLYWTVQLLGAEGIQRANFDGSNVEDLLTGPPAPFGIALDASPGPEPVPVPALESA